MKAKQKNLRIFEIEITTDEAFFAYMEKNKILLKEFFLLIHGHISSDVTDYLDKEGFCYKLARDCPIKTGSRERSDEKSAIIEPKSTPKVQEPARKHTVIAEKVRTLVLRQPIRSGVEIDHAGDVTIFARVNSAAKVIAEGNVEVYGVIDGLVQCDGEYMIVKDLGKGHIIFNGEILDSDLFDGRVKRITYGKSGVEIKDLFETTHY
jgi:septum site-determining protein MinC